MYSYKELDKIYHMDRSSSRDANLQKELDSRLKCEFSFRLGYETSYGELFFTLPKELSVLNEEVLRTETKIAALFNQLPSIAQNSILRSLVLDEVVSTNAIEDIHSTRRQIKDALNTAENNHTGKRRFKEIAHLYLGIIENTTNSPNNIADIRNIYDKLTAGEIPDDKKPDGIHFRKEGVDITAGGIRVIHKGLEPESKIIESLEFMLSLLQSEEIPSLFSTIISHYLFEYAHPFYDGNGRTGRYLLSLYLSDVLSVSTALSVSRTIAENKEQYYKAFRTVEKPLNHGELTFFIYNLLDLIQKAQFGVIDRLETCLAQLNKLDETMTIIEAKWSLKKKEKAIVLLLLQYETFGLFGDAPLTEIAEYLQVGTQQARKYLLSLEEKNICVRIENYNPITFALHEDIKNYLD